MTGIKIEKLTQLIKELNDNDINWSDMQENNYNISFEETYSKTWIELMGELRSLLKRQSYEGCCDYLKELLAEYDWLDNVIKYADETLQYYYALAGLRKQDEESSEAVCNFMVLAFQNYIIRVNKEFAETYQQFGMKDEEEMIRTLRLLDALTDFYVSNCYARNIIKKDFKGESDLSDTVCEVYAELVDKNYMEIKMNLIFNKLNSLEAK